MSENEKPISVKRGMVADAWSLDNGQIVVSQSGEGERINVELFLRDMFLISFTLSAEDAWLVGKALEGIGTEKPTPRIPADQITVVDHEG